GGARGCWADDDASTATAHRTRAASATARTVRAVRTRHAELFPRHSGPGCFERAGVDRRSDTAVPGYAVTRAGRHRPERHRVCRTGSSVNDDVAVDASRPGLC